MPHHRADKFELRELVNIRSTGRNDNRLSENPAQHDCGEPVGINIMRIDQVILQCTQLRPCLSQAARKHGETMCRHSETWNDNVPRVLNSEITKFFMMWHLRKI